MKKTKQQPRKPSVKRKTTKPTKPVRRNQTAKTRGKETGTVLPTPTPVPPVPATTSKVSKKDIVIALLHREEGATLTELTTATGWQAHSVRGFISDTLRKKLGLTVERVPNPKEPAYRVAPKRQ